MKIIRGALQSAIRQPSLYNVHCVSKTDLDITDRNLKKDNQI